MNELNIEDQSSQPKRKNCGKLPTSPMASLLNQSPSGQLLKLSRLVKKIEVQKQSSSQANIKTIGQAKQMQMEDEKLFSIAPQTQYAIVIPDDTFTSTDEEQNQHTFDSNQIEKSLKPHQMKNFTNGHKIVRESSIKSFVSFKAEPTKEYEKLKIVQKRSNRM